MIKVILLLITLIASNVDAVDRFVSPSGSGSTCSSGSPCAMQTGLDQAVSGDRVVAQDGTYTDRYDIDQNSGSVSNPITLIADNCHAAILQGDNNSDSGDIGLDINRGGWKIDCLDIQDYYVGVQVSGTNGVPVEVTRTLITNFAQRGVFVNNSSSPVNVNNSVIALIRITLGFGNGQAGIWCDNGCKNSTFERNFVYSVHEDNGLPGSGFQQEGYDIYFLNDSDNNVARGNIMMDNTKACASVFNDSGANATNNTMRDNICAFSSKGAGFLIQLDNCAPNLFANNLFYEVKSQQIITKGCDAGTNTLLNNTIIMNEFSAGQLELSGVGSRLSNTNLDNNLIYSTLANEESNWLYFSAEYFQSVNRQNNNLFWRPGSDETFWICFDGQSCAFAGPGARYDNTDIADENQEPQFVDFNNGNFSLQAGSPGKNAGTDGNDIGIQYNEFLRVADMDFLLDLQTAEVSPAGTSHTFTGLSNAHRYQVFVFLPQMVPLIIALKRSLSRERASSETTIS